MYKLYKNIQEGKILLPSVNQTSKKKNLSNKYGFIPTTRILETFAKENWLPVMASEVRARGERYGFQKHMIRLRQPNPINPQFTPEIIVTNSHSGESCFQIMAGVFRFVCENGLIVADSMFATHKIRHSRYAEEAVFTAIEGVQKTIPSIISNIDRFKGIQLSKDEQMAFAISALQLERDEEEIKDININVTASRLLETKREADRELNLWNTFNIIQEKFIKGGRYEVRDANKYGLKAKKTRAINNINRNINLNRSLWTLTEFMAELKNQ